MLWNSRFLDFSEVYGHTAPSLCGDPGQFSDPVLQQSALSLQFLDYGMTQRTHDFC